MAIDFEAISKRNLARDGALVIVGTLLFAVGLNCFMEPNGLAPGGISGIAIIIRAPSGSSPPGYPPPWC